MIAVTMALLLGAGEAGLAPFDFLVGHCWRGDLPKPGLQDTHCFTRLDDGRIKDIHTVTAADKAIFGGETTYGWDAAAGAISYVYVDAAMGRMTGTVRMRPGVLDFPDGVYVGGDGVKIAITVTWTRDGDAYVMRETSADMPALNRTTRYARID